MKRKTKSMVGKSKATIDKKSMKTEAFKTIIISLKERASSDKVEISDQEIISKLNITAEQFNSYLTTDEAPREIFDSLRELYKVYLKNHTFHKFVFIDTVEDTKSK